MNAKRLAVILCAVLTATLTARAADEAPYGKFEGAAFDGTHDMQWTFLRGKDGPTISATIRDPKDPKAKGNPRNLALAGGRDIKVTGNTVEFTLQWSDSHKLRGPKDAKYVAEVKGDTLTVKWTAGDEKGELKAKNQNPAVAKKDDKKAPAGEPQKVYLSGLTDDKGIPIEKGTITQLALVHVMGNASKAEFLKVTKDTKFVVVDGDEKKTYDQKTVLGDPTVRAAFRERQVTLERKGNVAVTVTATAVKDKK
jgi:hypothetical protein